MSNRNRRPRAARCDLRVALVLGCAEWLERRLLLAVTPVDQFLFDEGSGINVSDTGSPGGNKGVLLGATPPTFAPGPSGAAGDRALSFTGNGSFNSSLNSPGNGIVQTSGNLDSVLGGTASLAAWVKTTAIGNEPTWAAPSIAGAEQQGGVDDIRWGYLDSLGQAGIQAGDGPSALSTTPINDGQWHLLVFTRDAGTGVEQVYVDGILQSQAVSDIGFKHTPFRAIGATTVVDLSESVINGYTCFNGQLDDVRIYDTVLSPAQVAGLLPSTDHAPAAPSHLTTNPLATLSTTLRWTDNADNELRFIVLRATSASGPFATIGSADAVPGTGGTSSFVDSSIVQPGQTYFYEVEAYNAFNSGTASAPAGPASVTTPRSGNGIEAHYFGQGFWAGPVVLGGAISSPIDFTWPGGSADPSIRNFANSVAFTGKVVTDDAGVYTFVSNTDDDGYLYVNGVLVSSDPGLHGPEDAKRLTPITLGAHQQYEFVFLETNNAGGAAAHLEWITPAMARAGAAAAPTIVPLNNLMFPADAPTAPGNLVLDGSVNPNPSPGRVDFTFTADNVGVVHYILERSEDGGQTWTAINQTDPGSAIQTTSGTFVPATLRIEDASAMPRRSYQYRVRSVDFDGTSQPSNLVSVGIPGTLQTPGVEGHFYNAEIASAGDGEDPRNFAIAGFTPTEFIHDTNGITATSGGPIDSDFSTSSPDSTPYPDVPRVHQVSYASAWTGKIITDQAGVYTFITNSDDDGYMYINDTLVSADPGDHGAENPATVIPITLSAQTAYNFVIIQQQRQGASAIHVYWIEPGQNTSTVIPAYVPPLLGLPARGGLEQVMDAPHQQLIDLSSGNYTVDDPAASAAGDLTIASAFSSGVALDWTDQSTSELWFEVQRTSDDPASLSADWATVGRTGFGIGSFTDATAADASANRVYSYRVRGVNFDAAGPWSGVVITNDVTPALIAQACEPGMIRLLISGQSPNSGGFEIQQSSDGVHWIGSAGSPAPPTTKAFDINGLDLGAVYEFRARNLAGPGAPAASPYSSIATASGGGPQPITFGAGFPSDSRLELNGSANLTPGPSITPNALQITPNLTFQAGSAFATDVQNITAFETSFDFTFPQTNSASDGITFVIQNSPAGTGALGLTGGSLGYETIPNSVAIKFDLYSNAGEGPDSTGLFVDGDSPTVPRGGNAAEAVVDMTASGVNLHSVGHTFRVHLIYDGVTLQETVVDLTNNAIFTHNYAVNIPPIVGGTCAYVGFTGGTGSGTAEQDILRWTFVGTPSTVSGTGGNDTITLKRDADGTDIDWIMNGGPVVTVPASAQAGLTINSNGGTDTIILDNSGGNPLPTLLKTSGNFTLQGLTGLAFGQRLDLTSGALRIAYSGQTPLALIQGYLRSGYDGGRWDGQGIISSSIASHSARAVADVDNGSAITLSLRRIGDANGDGKVDFKDLVALAQSYGKSGAGIDWSKGDFSYDGAVDFTDLVLLAQNYGSAPQPGTATTSMQTQQRSGGPLLKHRRLTAAPSRAATRIQA